jgi:hypothetical protein
MKHLVEKKDDIEIGGNFQRLPSGHPVERTDAAGPFFPDLDGECLRIFGRAAVIGLSREDVVFDFDPGWWRRIGRADQEFEAVVVQNGWDFSLSEARPDLVPQDLLEAQRFLEEVFVLGREEGADCRDRRLAFSLGSQIAHLPKDRGQNQRNKPDKFTILHLSPSRFSPFLNAILSPLLI